MSKKNKLDQYYTSEEIAKFCWERLLWKYPTAYSNKEFIEPSAGSGAFLRDDVNITGFDIEPKHPNIVQMDFLNTDKTLLKGKFVIGNPPFGWASSLAVRFLNHCSEADVIGFILPKTFMKKVFQEDKVDRHLHLVGEWELPKNSFILEGNCYDVPCCFQIWERKEQERESLKIETFIKECENGELFLRRVGGRSGQFVSKEDYTESTTYRVSCNEQVEKDIISLYPKIKVVASQTAGVRSITLKEINYLLTKEIYESK